MTLKTALLQGTKLLEDGEVIAPRLTAEVLLGHAVQRTREYLFAYPEYELTATQQLHYGRYLHERLQGKPTQYITHRQEFWNREFRVSPAVLIPRPETEHVVETALRLAPAARDILDIGSGSGALAITLQLELKVAAVGTDISPEALAVAHENAQRLGSTARFACCDLASAIAPASVDLIVSNPPYVPLKHQHGLQREVRDYEPHVALFGGIDGFDLYDRIVADAPSVLRRGGWIAMELGFGTHEHVHSLFGPAWTDVELVPDLAGIPRVIAARLL